MNRQIQTIFDKAQSSLEAAQMLAAQDYRSQADYSYGPGVPEEHVQNALIWAGEFLEAARTYLGGK